MSSNFLCTPLYFYISLVFILLSIFSSCFLSVHTFVSILPSSLLLFFLPVFLAFSLLTCLSFKFSYFIIF